MGAAAAAMLQDDSVVQVAYNCSRAKDLLDAIDHRLKALRVYLRQVDLLAKPSTEGRNAFSTNWPSSKKKKKMKKEDKNRRRRSARPSLAEKY